MSKWGIATSKLGEWDWSGEGCNIVERVMFKSEKELIVKENITWVMVADIYKPGIQDTEAQESL